MLISNPDANKSKMACTQSKTCDNNVLKGIKQIPGNCDHKVKRYKLRLDFSDRHKEWYEICNECKDLIQDYDIDITRDNLVVSYNIRKLNS